MSSTIPWKTRRIYLPVGVRAILLLAPMLAAVFIPGEFADTDGTPWLLVIVFVVMVICMWPLGWISHWIEGEADGLRLRYWPFLSRRIRYSDLASVEFRKSASPAEFAGIGLRLAPGGVLALVNRRGPGIGLRTTEGRAYFVILADVDELAMVQGHVAGARPDLAQRIDVAE
ncbi:hypothetical protein MN032_03030 [Agromyces atrinae]|uniref:hypothetical protein n=1 Tax=Agromyces atrinae TaxID=592376 RepID=UPI001F561068|nr:hypothetical protein [Agromyces atrinae]MCI2956656.1 hypothetical protein [Agromyces atrinae]